MKRWMISSATGAVLFWSVILNVVLSYQLLDLRKYKTTVSQKEKLVDDNYKEIFLTYMEKIKNTQDEILIQQGRVEGILAVVHNYNPDENLHTAVWHDGYNQGEANNKEGSYEDGYHKALDDLYCPAQMKEPFPKDEEDYPKK